MDWACERMPEFLVYGELILHSPLMQSVCLLPIGRFFLLEKDLKNPVIQKGMYQAPCFFFYDIVKCDICIGGYGSVGRATGSQSVGRRFDPGYLHF